MGFMLTCSSQEGTWNGGKNKIFLKVQESLMS